jgi:hypothetical protein
MAHPASPFFLRLAVTTAILLAVGAAVLRAGDWQPARSVGSARAAVGAQAAPHTSGQHWWTRLLGG